MKRQTIILSALLAIGVLYLLHVLGIIYFYWTYWWYDVITHFLGGMVVGLGLCWALFSLKNFRTKILIVFISTLLIGIGWEVFEYYYDISKSQENYTRDTLNDLTLDVAGALLVVALTSKKRNV